MGHEPAGFEPDDPDDRAFAADPGAPAGRPDPVERVDFDGWALPYEVDDQDELDDADGGAALLPPDDRLWRHPSEIASAGLPSAALPTPTRAGRRPKRRATSTRPPAVVRSSRERWLPLVLAGAVGALLSAGVFAISGHPATTAPPVLADGPTTALVAQPVVSVVHTAGVADLAAHVAGSVVELTIQGRTSSVRSSALVAPGGHAVLASRHLIEGADSLAVLVGGVQRRATEAGDDPDTDLALLTVDGDPLPVPPWGHSASLRPGDAAVAVTADQADSPTVTLGVVSGLSRTAGDLHGLLELDRPVAESSGGAVLDSDGAVVGITISPTSGVSGFGYAVPADEAVEVAKEIEQHGHVQHAWLGLDGADRSTGAGVLVRTVHSGGPAARVGLAAGDTIVELGSTPVGSMSDLMGALHALRVGDTTIVGYIRNGVRQSIGVTLADRPT